MTQINANAFTGLSATPPSLSMTDAGFVLAAGIMGKAMNPLGAGPLAFGSLPSLWAVSAFTAARPEPQAQWTATTGSNGRGSIDLGDGYTLSLNENSSEVTIHNANTGEETRIWGDPHVDVDGKRAFDFWGTTTFTLENGTKITINTEQYAKNPNEYLAEQLVITKGDQAIVVDGLSENKLGDLSISMSSNGALLDAATRDGFVVTENGEGQGWLSSFTGEVATQADADITRVGQLYGPGSAMPSLEELGSLFTPFLTFGVLVGVAIAAETAKAALPHNAQAFVPQLA